MTDNFNYDNYDKEINPSHYTTEPEFVPSKITKDEERLVIYQMEKMQDPSFDREFDESFFSVPDDYVASKTLEEAFEPRD